MTTELTKAAQQALEQLEFLNACYPHKTAADAIASLQSALTQRPAAQEVHPLASRCYAMSEPHLSGYRLVLGFETLEAVDAAHTWVANVRKATQQATPEPVLPFLVRDVAALLGATVPDVCKALTQLGHGQRSTNMAIAPYEALEVAAHIRPATPEPVGEPIRWWNGCDKSVPDALRFLANNPRPDGWSDRYNAEHLFQLAGEIERMARQPLFTRPAPGVPEDSELLDYLDTLAARPAGSDLHCLGGRVVLYVRTGISSQIEASGAGTAREALRAALAATQAKGGV